MLSDWDKLASQISCTSDFSGYTYCAYQVLDLLAIERNGITVKPEHRWFTTTSTGISSSHFIIQDRSSGSLTTWSCWKWPQTDFEQEIDESSVDLIQPHRVTNNSNHGGHDVFYESKQKEGGGKEEGKSWKRETEGEFWTFERFEHFLCRLPPSNPQAEI